ncbi:MAG: translation elongation factor Ts [Patescibacteria group bacterium]|nr:translation elongation factor Ts [Patescibacteria group bacterium]
MNIDLDLLKKLRAETQAGIADCRKALEEVNGDYQKAKEWLRKHGLERADKKKERKTPQGLIESYIHQNGKVGALVMVLCETDFVARTDEFKRLSHELAMQVAAMNPQDIDSLLEQAYIRDGSKTIGDLLKEAVAKLGENIVLERFQRFGIE